MVRFCAEVMAGVGRRAFQEADEHVVLLPQGAAVRAHAERAASFSASLVASRGQRRRGAGAGAGGGATRASARIISTITYLSSRTRKTHFWRVADHTRARVFAYLTFYHMFSPCLPAAVTAQDMPGSAGTPRLAGSHSVIQLFPLF